MSDQAKAERKSDREFVATRIIHASSENVFKAWTEPALFRQWWVPKSAPMTLDSCEIDARKGGTYRLRFGMNSQTMDFFGRYLEVSPGARLVWTNDEGGEEAAAVTTVTFQESKGATLITVHDLYPSVQALDEAIANGSTEGIAVQLDQLNEFITNA